MRQTPFRYMLLPHYSFTLAPIELVFAKLKKQLQTFIQMRLQTGSQRRGRTFLMNVSEE